MALEHAPMPTSNSAFSDNDEMPAVLLVDDNPKNLMALGSVLEDGDYLLVSAQTGEEALRALVNRDFAAIVLDVQMPDLNGIELARLIKQRKSTQHIPILFLTAHYREDEHAVLAYDVGAVDYLTKPINSTVLRSKVNVFVDLYRKTRALASLNGSLQAEILERRTAEERFRVVVEAAPSAMLLFNGDGILQLVNSQAEQMFGYPRSELLTMPLAHLLPELSPSEWLNRNAQESSARHKDRGSFPVEINYRAIQSTEGEFFFASVMDVTDRKKSEEALRTANAQLEARNIALQSEAEERMRRIRAEAAQAEAEAASAAKDRFLAMLSHELRTPLTPILYSVAHLEDRDDCPEPVREVLAMISRNVRLEARLIDDLLDLSRIRNGKLTLQLQTIDGHEVLQDALQICLPEIQRKKIQLDQQLEAKSPMLKGDPARLQQIFWNLLTNATKFTPEEGRILVKTKNSEDGELLKIEVTDTGVGVEPEKQARIFDAFEQATRSPSAGLGLGLAICKALVDLHGGVITMTSPGANFGATFLVELPAAQGKPQASKPKERDVTSHPELRILLVEDHADSAEMLKSLLSLYGYHVETAGNVADAMEAASRYDFDILISDIGLPDGRGTELLHQLQERAGRTVKAIALSGFGMEDDLERSRAAGFAEHLTKPVEFATLRAALTRLATASAD